MRGGLIALALCGVVFTLGCGVELTKEEGERRAAGGGGIAGMAGGDMLGAAPSSTPDSAPAEEPAPAETESPVEEPQPAEQESTAPPANTTAAEDAVTVGTPSGDPNVETVKAKRGVGKTGRYEGSGMVITPIKAYFLTKQRTELEIKLPQAMNLYKAEHGHYPKSLEDFMRDIIEFNQIKLPELPPGHRYVYDAKTGELAVERPRE